MTVPLNYDEISMQEKFMMLEQLYESMSHKAKDNGFTPQ